VYIDLEGYYSWKEFNNDVNNVVDGGTKAWEGAKTGFSELRKALPVISREVSKVPEKIANSFTPKTTAGQVFATILYTGGEFVTSNVMAPITAAGAVEEASQNPTKMNVGLAILATSPYAPKGSGRILKKFLGKEAIAGEKLLTKEVESGAKVLETEVADATKKEGAEFASDVEKEIRISRSRHPESAQHIEDAINSGKPDTLTLDRKGAAANRREALRETKTTPGKDRDEYPPAMFKEGGDGASVRPIEPKDNRGSGACIGAQCKDVSDGSRVRIKITE
jgi:hypothetical protein